MLSVALLREQSVNISHPSQGGDNRVSKLHVGFMFYLTHNLIIGCLVRRIASLCHIILLFHFRHRLAGLTKNPLVAATHCPPPWGPVWQPIRVGRRCVASQGNSYRYGEAPLIQFPHHQSGGGRWCLPFGVETRTGLE